MSNETLAQSDKHRGERGVLFVCFGLGLLHGLCSCWCVFVCLFACLFVLICLLFFFFFFLLLFFFFFNLFACELFVVVACFVFGEL